MFVRRQMIGGEAYYQYLKSYREGRKVKLRAISSLRKHSSLQDALNGAKRMGKEERIRRAAVTERR